MNIRQRRSQSDGGHSNSLKRQQRRRIMKKKLFTSIKIFSVSRFLPVSHFYVQLIVLYRHEMLHNLFEYGQWSVRSFTQS